MANILEEAQKKVRDERAKINAAVAEQERETRKAAKRVKGLMAKQGIKCVEEYFKTCDPKIFHPDTAPYCGWQKDLNAHAGLVAPLGTHPALDTLLVEVSWYKTHNWYVDCYALHIKISPPLRPRHQGAGSLEPFWITVSQRDHDRDYTVKGNTYYLRSDREVWELLREELTKALKRVVEEYYRSIV